MKWLLALSLVIAAVRAQAPIPARPPGVELWWSKHDPQTVQLEVFMDPLCSDCKEAYPMLKELKYHYGNAVRLLANMFPLPYHRNSFLAAQAFHLVNHQKDKYAAFRLLEALFETQEWLYNVRTMNMTEMEVLKSLGAVVRETTGMHLGDFIKNMTAEGAPSDHHTRVAWKYACTRGVFGTPQFFVNGVAVNAGASWSLAEWKKVLDPLVFP